MLAVGHSQFGPGEQVAELIDVPPPPAPEAGQVLIAMEAVPINPGDLLRFEGRYGKDTATLPIFAGGEGVGRVVDVGADVKHLKRGDRVLAHQVFAKTGTWREQILMPAAVLVPLPDNDPLQLSMLMVNPATARLMLTEFVDLQPGEWVIQNAANSGVGCYLNRLAQTRQLRLINIVRRDSAVAEVHLTTPDALVLVDGPDLPDRIAALTEGALPRLAIDAIGGEATQNLGSSVAEGGVVVNYGLLSGEACRIAARDTVFRDVSLRGFWLARWWNTASREEIAALYTELGAMLGKGDLTIPVEATYPLARVKDALAHAAKPHRSGKVIITIP